MTWPGGPSVTFTDQSLPTPCWAHTADRRYCEGDNDCLHHGCNDHVTGRLGLCRYHEREILGWEVRNG